MTPTVCQTEKLDGVWPSAGRREELETPELLAGYLAKIGRGKLLTTKRRSPLPGGHALETKGPATSW
jgi:hypothetical protein